MRPDPYRSAAGSLAQLILINATIPGDHHGRRNFFVDSRCRFTDKGYRGRPGSISCEHNRRSTRRRRSGIESAATSLHGRAEGLAGGGQRAANFAHGAADKLNVTAEYIRGHDVKAMFDDVSALVKRNPVPALVGAAVLGFVLAKALSSRD
ncbi:MAG: hypothetical protein WDM77_07710 [Steroidobacteraceae bacterium]